jgi:hypothetical protein
VRITRARVAAGADSRAQGLLEARGRYAGSVTLLGSLMWGLLLVVSAVVAVQSSTLAGAAVFGCVIGLFILTTLLRVRRS